MFPKPRIAILANVLLALSTNSLPLSNVKIRRAHVEPRRISYSVVPVDGGLETSTSDVQMVVTVPGFPPPPVTETITATSTATETAPYPENSEDPVVTPTSTSSLETFPTPEVQNPPPPPTVSSPSTMPIPSSTGTLCQSEASWSILPSPMTLNPAPSSIFPLISPTPTSLTFHSPTLTPHSFP